MYRFLINFFFIFHLIALNSGEENLEHQFYDFQRIFNRLDSSLSLKDKLPDLVNNIHFNAIKRDFSLESLEYLSQNSSKCVKDILYSFESVSNASNQWSWNLFDSFGKPESGFFLGNLKWIGEYNQCIKVYAPPKAEQSVIGNFQGQYCSLTFDVPYSNQSVPLVLGICLPDSCSPKDLQDLQYEIIDLLVKAGGFPVLKASSVATTTYTITCTPKERHLTAAAKVVIALMSIFCILALGGSSITAIMFFKKYINDMKRSSLIINISDQEHIVTESQDFEKKNFGADNEPLLLDDKSNGTLDSFASFLKCFCVFTNGAKLLSTDSSEGQLLCIHGIRFLSMSWVILGHAYIFGYTETRNMIEGLDSLNDFLFQVVLQGFFSVDSFFVLSGFLLTYLSMMEFSKSNSINWIYFYIHRYIRLTPIYMVLLGFSATVFFYMGSGPYWPLTLSDANCEKSWWKNLLYINNFGDMQDQCFGWSWYLANDMQFFVISPIFLITLWRWPVVGYVLIGLFLAACMLSNFFITYSFNLFVGMVGFDSASLQSSGMDMMFRFMDYMTKIYIKPYTRIGPYLVGMIVGYLLYKHKTNNWPKLKKVYLCLGWIVTTTVTLTLVYGMYKTHPSLITRCFYNAFDRTLWGVGLSWVIYVCLTNQSDLVDRILSFKLFIPLSRLTYSAYLIHPMIITGYYTSMKRPLEFTHPTMVLLFLGFMVVTYAVAFPVSLILESPIVSLDKMIRNKLKSKAKTTRTGHVVTAN